MPKKSNVKFDQSGEPGPKEASGSTNEGASGVAGRAMDDSSTLGAIAAFHAELTLVKSEICRKIETEISEVTTTVRGEITITTLTAQVYSQKQTLKELTEAANGSSDIVQELESKVKTLCEQVNSLRKMPRLGRPFEEAKPESGRSKRRERKWTENKAYCGRTAEGDARLGKSTQHRQSP